MAVKRIGPTEEANRIRCPECRKTLALKRKGKIEVFMKSHFRCEIVVGAIICPKCEFKLSVPMSSLEGPGTKPVLKEARDARGT